MIRTSDTQPTKWQSDIGVQLIREDSTDVGVRILQAEPLMALGTIHVVNDYAPYDNIRTVVKVAYKDKYEGIVNYILDSKGWDDADNMIIRDSYTDYGRFDDRYHIFRCSKVEFLLNKGLVTVVFKDLDTHRDFVARSNTYKYPNIALVV